MFSLKCQVSNYLQSTIKMALLHSTKLTHYFSPSKSHLESFFDAITGLYEEQEHTDLNLVAADGTAFRIHQVSVHASLHYRHLIRI